MLHHFSIPEQPPHVWIHQLVEFYFWHFALAILDTHLVLAKHDVMRSRGQNQHWSLLPSSCSLYSHTLVYLPCVDAPSHLIWSNSWKARSFPQSALANILLLQLSSVLFCLFSSLSSQVFCYINQSYAVGLLCCLSRTAPVFLSFACRFHLRGRGFCCPCL